MNKRALLLGLILIAAISTGCTVQQLAFLNIQPDQPAYAPLLALDDVPVPLADGSVLELDGSVTPAPPPPPQTSASSVWDRLAQCESGGNWAANTGNGFYGGLQFLLSSWRAVGGTGYPHQASRAEQISRAEKLLAAQGWRAWPRCSRKLGLR